MPGYQRWKQCVLTTPLRDPSRRRAVQFLVPGAVSRLRHEHERPPPPRTIVSCGYRENGRSILRPEYSILSFHDREEKEEGKEVLVGNFGYFSFQNWKGNGEIEIFIYFILFLDLTFYVDGSIRGFDIHINRLFNYYYFNPTNIYESSMIYSLSDISTHLETRFLEIIYNSVSL